MGNILVKTLIIEESMVFVMVVFQDLAQSSDRFRTDAWPLCWDESGRRRGRDREEVVGRMRHVDTLRHSVPRLQRRLLRHFAAHSCVSI